jgi:hypothetical protein
MKKHPDLKSHELNSLFPSLQQQQMSSTNTVTHTHLQLLPPRTGPPAQILNTVELTSLPMLRFEHPKLQSPPI